MEPTTIASWILAALTHWAAVPSCPSEKSPDPCDAFSRLYHEPVESYAGRAKEIAETIDRAVELDAVAPAEGRPRAALNLMAIAFEESGLRRWVDDGSCNTQLGIGMGPPPGEWSCDGGKAYTVFQLRPDLAWEKLPSGPELLADRDVTAQTAWRIYRTSPRQWSTWRRARALSAAWVAAHPFKE